MWGKKKIVQRDTWLGADETLVKQSLWNRIGAVPNECEEQLVKEEFFDELQKTTFINNLNNTRIFEEGVFLQNKKVPKLVLYPELQAAKKGREKEFDVWGQSIQEWIFNQVCIVNLIDKLGFKL